MSKQVHYSGPGNWQTNVSIADDGRTCNVDHLTLATLCVIRDELKQLNQLLSCSRFVAIPTKLDEIVRNTRRKKKRPVKAKPRLRVVSR